MRKKFLLVAVIAVCFAITVSGTIAYFTTKDTAHNIITSGGVNIEIVEKTVGKDGSVQDFPEEGIDGAMPGEKISKVVSVNNTGKSEAWIRVRVETTIKGADGKELPLKIEGVGPVISYHTDSSWFYQTDGYYYYTKPVAPGESTAVLFDSVTLAPQMGNMYQNCNTNIVISAQAVQTANNGTTVIDALGWPES